MRVLRLIRQSIDPRHSRLPPLNASRHPSAMQRATPNSSQQTHPALLPNLSTPPTSVNGTSPPLLPTSNTHAQSYSPHRNRVIPTGEPRLLRLEVEGPWHDLNLATNLDGISLFAHSFFTSLLPPPYTH